MDDLGVELDWVVVVVVCEVVECGFDYELECVVIYVVL